MTPRRRLGWLGPAIVAVGVAVAALGAWIVVTGRPKAGDVIDTIVIDDKTAIVIRAEDGGERNFVELHKVVDGADSLAWQAIVPPYAGRPGAPGIAYSEKSVTVRVIRDRRAEVFAIATRDAAKLGGFKLAPGKGPVVKQTQGPVTLSDRVRSYELVEGEGWHQLVAVDLTSGEGLWKQDLSGAPIEAAGITGPVAGSTEGDQEAVWVQQAGIRRRFRARDGSEESTSVLSPKSS